MRKFTAKPVQVLYDSFVRNPPTDRSSTLRIAFHEGFNEPSKPPRYAEKTICYAAWAAGVDVRHKELGLCS